MSKSIKLSFTCAIVAPLIIGFLLGDDSAFSCIAGLVIGYGLHYWGEKLKWTRAGMTMEEVEAMRRGLTEMRDNNILPWEQVRRELREGDNQ